MARVKPKLLAEALEQAKRALAAFDRLKAR